ncbi:hypothetical protein GCM10010528_29710 [Gordonia defluvii]|uniref:Transcriptional regulator, AbiEi antitoxin, Type IV TA system n=1 Tax=Gordonia defluvii TaxID=283718 RepID=A0ABP6LKB4_9ACTN
MPSPEPSAIITRSDAVARGMTDRELARLERVARGLYRTSPEQQRYPEAGHREVALAIAGRAASHNSVVSHHSAATIHRLPMLRPDLSRLHLTRREGMEGNRRRTRHTHPGPLGDEEIVVVEGVVVTTIERTAIDVARGSDFAEALTVVDSALRAGADHDLMAQLCERSRQRGIAVARCAVATGSPLAANPGESWSRAQMIVAKFPSPGLQRELWVEGTQYFVDFDFAGEVVGEFDGQRKYTKDLRPGEDASQAVIREKNRENAIRSTGAEVVRWDWNDLGAGRMIPRLGRALRGRRLI